jgi:hypothetical protein
MWVFYRISMGIASEIVRSFARGRQGSTIVETAATAHGNPASAFVPFIAGTMTRTILGARTAFESEFGQGFFVGFRTTLAMGTLAESPGTIAVD